MSFNFKPADNRALIHTWLEQPHVAKWFYGDGLQNTYVYLDQFLKGNSEMQFWIVSDRDHPFAFFITSDAENGAITLDMAIGDPDYLGRGLAPGLIREFLKAKFPTVTKVLIDPELTNTRAIHVYQKAGFKAVKEFIPAHSPHPHLLMQLLIKS